MTPCFLTSSANIHDQRLFKLFVTRGEILIPGPGTVGAALASSIAYIFVTFLAVVIFLLESGASLKATLIINKSDLQLYLAWIKRLKFLTSREPQEIE